MKTRKYPDQSERIQKNEPRVAEHGAKYERSLPSKGTPPTFGVSVGAARKRLRRPMKRSAEQVKWALAIAGIGAGPKDLAVNMRAYLRREK